MNAAATTSPGHGAQGGQAPAQFLRLALGGDMHTVRIDSVREILQLSPITPLPLMPAFVRGVMNLRGAVVPVVDLAARLGLPAATPTKRSCVVIVDVHVDDVAAAQTFGTLVDAVFEVFEADEAELEAVPRLGTRIAPRFVNRMVRVRGVATPELDLQAILDEKALVELVRTSSSFH